jgi:hypothetical protein
MKIITKVTALLLVSVFLFSLTSCSYTLDVTERITTHLEKEYPEKSFDIIDYEQHNETSGRYEVNLRCRDDGINFRMFVYSSISITDSYSVERANSCMKDLVFDKIDTEVEEQLKNLQWYDIYADRAANYRFRKIEVDEEFSLSDIKSIYQISFKDGIDPAKIGGYIYDFVYALCAGSDSGCSFDSAAFVYKIDRTTYTFTTDSQSVLNLGRDGIIHFVITNISDPSKKEISLTYSSEGTVKEENKDSATKEPDVTTSAGTVAD